jgi:hypothetical protein
MDPVSLAYYAAVCGALALAAPWLGRLPVRLAAGAVVGLAAAGALPLLQVWLGSAGYAASQ